ncbi:valacyclovir hydrolase [Musca domestica]|uniref:Valacyclovir hydrolase n=1 Tax=Musca domestica TaxID=7370 RepID=A0A1I8MFL0_MUSDO|nr:valacyclovir hydrolase [Musca domestica]
MLQLRLKAFSSLVTLPRIVTKRFSHVEQKVNVNGININIVQCGNGDKSLLLMPGALGSAWTDFKPQIEKLPKLLPNYKIIAWDPPGYGMSIPPKRKWGLDVFHNDARCAVDLMTQLGRPKFSIIGWSGGGITGLIAAGTYINNVEKLIVCAAGAYLIPTEVKAFHGLRDVSQWSPSMREPMEKLYGPERFVELWNEWVDMLYTFQQENDGDFCRKEVSRITAPTLILRGNKDSMIAPEPMAYLRDHIKSARYYEFPDGKHNFHLRYVDEFNRLVADFLLAN